LTKAAILNLGATISNAGYPTKDMLELNLALFRGNAKNNKTDFKRMLILHFPIQKA